MKPVPILLCLSLLFVSPFHTDASSQCWDGCSYQCWNAQSSGVTSPSHFLIDRTMDKIVLAAKNSVCHLSLDLNSVDNVQDTAPSDDRTNECENELFQNPEECQNYHHILLLPTTTSHMTTTTSHMTAGSSNTPISDTILECGTNAFSPQCTYRSRSDLTEISVATGSIFIPDDRSSTITSLWTSTSRLVSATPLDHPHFGIVMSNSPYDGAVHVGTRSNWFDISLQFISMYEIDDYIYTFFLENPDETTQNDIYARVSRICKGDMGVADTSTSDPVNYQVFTSFVKARMTCVSGTNIPYYYNDIQDTFLLESGSYDDGASNERHLYAVFTAQQNGPEGSAVCVYTFGSNTNDLDRVFDGKYSKRTGLSNFETVDNPTPFTCSTTRSLEDANDLHLMQSVAVQSSESIPVLQLTGYNLRQIAVTSTLDVDGLYREVMFIAGEKGGSNMLIKAVYDAQEQKHYIIWEDELKLSEAVQSSESEVVPRITQMEIHNSGNMTGNAVYIGTTEGLYRVPVADCGRYTDCCSCVSARDPYCGYDRDSQSCVALSDDNRSNGFVQSLESGDIDACLIPTPTSQPVSEPTTSGVAVAVTTETVESSSSSSTTSDGVQATPSPVLVTSEPPSVGGSRGSESSTNLLGTIMGSVFGFVGGVVLGIIVMAFCLKNKDRRFVWNKYIGNSSSRRREEETSRNEKGASNNEPRGPPPPTAPKTFSKQERNNSEMKPHSKASAVVHVNEVDAISNLSTRPYNGKQGSKDPPPYSETPTKPSYISNGGVPPRSSVTSPEKSVSRKEKKLEMVDTPTRTSHSTPQHKVNKDTPTRKSHPTPQNKINKDVPTHTSQSTPQHKDTPKPLTLSPPAQAKPTPPILSPPAQATPTHPQPHFPPLTPSQGHPQPHLSKPTSYHQAYSQSSTPPPSGHYSTLPHKKRHQSTSHSSTTPPQRPSSADSGAAVLSRPASAQNLSHAAAPAPARSTAVPTTPTKTRVPSSPFSFSPVKGGVPSSPFNTTPSAGTPVSTSSSGGSTHGRTHFQFPSDTRGATTKPSRTPYTRSDGGQVQIVSRNPNMKATGVAVEPTTNQERERYGNNVAARVHTIDRKSKVPNGHSRSQPLSPVTNHSHPHTTVIEIDGGYVGCTDC